MKLPVNVINRVVLPLSIGAAVYFFVVRPLMGRKRKSEEERRQFVRNLDVGTNLTITLPEAKEIASKIEQELTGLNFWINTDFWENVLDQLKTKDDVRLVTKEFGVRDGETLQEWVGSEAWTKFQLWDPDNIGARVRKKFVI